MVLCNLSVEKDLGSCGIGGLDLVGSSMDALTVTVGAIGLSDFLFSTVPLLARKPTVSAASVSSSLFFSESRLLKIDFLRLTTGRLAGAGATGVAGVAAGATAAAVAAAGAVPAARSPTAFWTGSSGFVSRVLLAGDGERETGALDNLLLRRFARDLDFEGERVLSPSTGAGRTLAESMLAVPSLTETGGLGSCSLSAVTVILGLLCSSATRS